MWDLLKREVGEETRRSRKEDLHGRARAVTLVDNLDEEAGTKR